MNFYSYSNNNSNYTKAVSLENVRTVEIYNGSGKSDIRFGVRIAYCDGTTEDFTWLEHDEARTVYKQIINLLND